MNDLTRRKLIGSLISLVAAPAIVRVSSIMPAKVMEPLRYMGVDLAFDDASIRCIWRGYRVWASGEDGIVHWQKIEHYEEWPNE